MNSNEYLGDDYCDCKWHYNELDTGCGINFPAYVNAMSDKEQEERLQIDDEVAILDDEHFFIQGNIYLRVVDGEPDEAFTWGVWVKISRESFLTLGEHWETPGRENLLDSQPGLLCSEIPIYPKTMNLEVGVYTLQLGQPPFIILTATDHPLSVEQREGITKARGGEIERLVMGE